MKHCTIAEIEEGRPHRLDNTLNACTLFNSLNVLCMSQTSMGRRLRLQYLRSADGCLKLTVHLSQGITLFVWLYLAQDYPSVAMIKSLLLEKGISPIFLTTITSLYNVRICFVTLFCFLLTWFPPWYPLLYIHCSHI